MGRRVLPMSHKMDAMLTTVYGLRLLSETNLSNDERKYGHQFSIDFSQYFA